MSQTASADATPATIARNAVRRVCEERHFRQSIRSIDCPGHQWSWGKKQASRNEFRRAALDLRQLTAYSGDPAEIVAFRLDWSAWMAGLAGRDLEIVKALGSGRKATELARQYGITDAGLSRIRDRLQASFEATQG